MWKLFERSVVWASRAVLAKKVYDWWKNRKKDSSTTVN